MTVAGSMSSCIGPCIGPRFSVYIFKLPMDRCLSWGSSTILWLSVTRTLFLILLYFDRDQPWYFFGRNDAKAETPVLWPPHAKSWLIGKDSDAGRDWGQEEKGTTEDEMAGWHHRLYGREFEWTPGVGDGQGGLVCCNSWGRKESDTTERLNWTELNWSFTTILRLFMTWCWLSISVFWLSFTVTRLTVPGHHCVLILTLASVGKHWPWDDPECLELFPD